MLIANACWCEGWLLKTWGRKLWLDKNNKPVSFLPAKDLPADFHGYYGVKLTGR